MAYGQMMANRPVSTAAGDQWKDFRGEVGTILKVDGATVSWKSNIRDAYDGNRPRKCRTEDLKEFIMPAEQALARGTRWDDPSGAPGYIVDIVNGFVWWRAEANDVDTPRRTVLLKDFLEKYWKI